MLFSFWKHHPGADQNASQLVKQTLQFQDQYTCDFVKITPAGTWQAVCQGAEDKGLNDNLGRRGITAHFIQKENDWLAIPDFSRGSTPLLNEMLSVCGLLGAVQKPVLPTLFCPISQAIQLAGLETFKKHILSAPEKVMQGIDHICKNTIFCIEEFKKGGASGIYYVSQHMQKGLIDEEVYRKFGSKFDALCLKACETLETNIFHIHGSEVFFAFDELPKNIWVQYEKSEANNLDKMYVKQSLVGLPVADMLKYTEEFEMVQYMNSFLKDQPSTKIITAQCVIPLDFPERLLEQWCKVIRAV